MSRLRFATAQEVFEAFPTARDDIEAAPSEDLPPAYLTALLDSPTPEDAIGFCAYLLPRREAVWWACQCLRALNPSLASQEAMAVQAAEAWVREPEEHRRLAAVQIGMNGDRRLAGTWAALAAAWSGGPMSGEPGAPPAAPSMTAKAVRAAVLIALSLVPVRARREHLRACVTGALRLVGAEAPVRSAG